VKRSPVDIRLSLVASRQTTGASQLKIACVSLPGHAAHHILGGLSLCAASAYSWKTHCG